MLQGARFSPRDNDRYFQGERAVKRLLVVEDEAVSRLALVEFLRASGYSVEETASGEEALNMLQNQTFDAAIVDFKLRGKVNALDVFSAFEKRTPGRAKILMTAYRPEQVNAESLGAHYISKPVNLDDLVQALERILQSKS